MVPRAGIEPAFDALQAPAVTNLAISARTLVSDESTFLCSKVVISARRDGINYKRSLKFRFAQL